MKKIVSVRKGYSNCPISYITDADIYSIDKTHLNQLNIYIIYKSSFYRQIESNRYYYRILRLRERSSEMCVISPIESAVCFVLFILVVVEYFLRCIFEKRPLIITQCIRIDKR